MKIQAPVSLSNLAPDVPQDGKRSTALQSGK